MSSASLVEKRSLRKSQSRNIETSSTSITSAPPTTTETKLHGSDRRLNEKSMRSKQRDSLPDIGARKGNRSVRASNFELSSSANDFESATNNKRRQSPTKPTAKSTAATKPKPSTSTTNINKSEQQPDDKILEMIKMNAVEQENYK